MSGYDDTYQAEVRAFHKYFPRDIFPNQEFLQAIKMGANGEPYIDWVAFHQVKKLEVMHDRPVDFIHRNDMRFTATTPPHLEPASALHLFGLGDEIHIGSDDDGHIVSCGCAFTTAVEMLCMELRIPFVLHVIQIPARGAEFNKSNRPRWYGSREVPETTTPIIHSDGKWTQGTKKAVKRNSARQPRAEWWF